MPFTNINGAQIYYKVAGSGKPVVFVHAAIADSRMWDSQFPVFAQKYRVARYDQREFGQSRPVEGEFSHLEDLHALLQHLKIDSAYLVGCSMGGGLIMDFALTYPKMVGALVMVGATPSGYDYTGEPPTLWTELVDAFKKGDLDRTAELGVRLFVVGLERTPDQVDARIRNLVLDMQQIALRNEKAGLGKAKPAQLTAVEHLAEIIAPTLIIVGDQDEAIVREAGEKMVAEMPAAQMVVLKDTAHLPNMEKPDEFNAVVQRFFDSLKNAER